MIGIYKITCKVNGRVYIGQSKCIGQRWNSHINRLECGKHTNKDLQKDFNEFGYKEFIFEILEECEEDDLLKLETEYINSYNYSYNISKKYSECDDENIGFININSGICEKLTKNIPKLAQHIVLVAYKYLNSDNYIELSAIQLGKEFNITSDSLYRDSDKIINSLENINIFKSINYECGLYILEFNEKYYKTDMKMIYVSQFYNNISNSNSIRFLIKILKNNNINIQIDDFKKEFNLIDKSYINYSNLKKYQIIPILNDIKTIGKNVKLKEIKTGKKITNLEFAM